MATQKIETGLIADDAVTSAKIGTLDANLEFGDSVKAIFGAGSDLQIFHDASGGHSRIDDTGTGGLVIRGSQILLEKYGGGYMLNAVQDGAVTIHYAGSEKLATTSTGIDVTGTAIMDGLTVDGTATIDGGSSVNTVLTLDSSTANTYLKITDSNSTNGTFIGATTNDLNFYPNNVLSATFAAGGDISFYEDTGTTAKFFWDASAESLGIGTTSPAFENGNGLEIRNAGGNGAHLKLTDAASGTGGTQGFDLYMFNTQGYIENYENAPIIFRQNGGESARFDASGNVGIGTSSPDTMLHLSAGSTGVAGGGDAAITMTNKYDNPDNSWKIAPVRSGVSNTGLEIRDVTDSRTDMVFDGAGNVGIGETTPDDTLHVNKAGGTARIRIGSGNDAYYTQKGYLGDTWVFGTSETGDVVTNTISGGAFTSSNTGGAFVWKIATSGGTPAEKMRIKSDGQITTQGDILPGADVIMANGRGISFAATANSSGSMSNELLDDYEEGTWTPVFTFDIGGSGIVYGARNGRYTKVGNAVTVSFKLIVSSGVGPSDYWARLSGIPFNANGTDHFSGRVRLNNTGSANFNLSVEGGTTSLLCFHSNGTSDYARGDHVVGQQLSGSFTYFTA